MRSSPLVLRLLLFLLVLAIGVFVAYRMITAKKPLPIYHPKQIDARLVDPSTRNASGEHHILPFNLIDQEGRHITEADVKGKVVLSDFFFTTCGSICPKMSTQFERVQEAFKDEPGLVLLSHSVTPEMDSVPQLKAYAEQHNADPAQWHLLTGDRKQIYNLARKSWFAVKDTGDGGPNDFVHTENFILADKKGRLRGFYDGTSKEDVDRAIGDIERLLEEE